MDTGEGRFRKFDKAPADEDIEIFRQKYKKAPKDGGIFSVGEELEIKGSKFRVTNIDVFGIRLKLLKQLPPPD